MFYISLIKDYIRKNILYLIMITLEVIMLSFFIYNYYKDNEKEDVVENDLLINNISNVEENTTNEEVITKVHIDIKGYVKNPGVYEVDDTSLVNDCITLAGGLLTNADTSNINLSKKVTDEMVIYIPKKGEKTTTTITNDALVKSTNTSSNTSKIININTATKAELTTLSGIGDSKAQNIIDYRSQNGNFKTIEDIKKVSGIGNAIYEKIKNYITV